MIFRTEKLEELKKIENDSSNSLLNNLSIKIITEVWPECQKITFCETIEEISVKWMNQFLVLIENWLAESSKRYIKKFEELKRSETKETTTERIEEYLLNFSKYIKSMEYPFMSSLNNIYNLYLKFPSDEMIQAPVQKLTKSISNNNSTSQVEIKKKKSLSIDSFTSNLPTKSRSTSKSRKISFFNNHSKLSMTTNLFQTLSKDFKQKNNENLNTTVKKVKKEITFNKTSHGTMNNFREESNIRHNENESHQKSVNNTHVLKQKLEERLSKTCSTTFFNQIVLEQPKENKKFLQENSNVQQYNYSSTLEQENHIDVKAQSINLQEELKKEILEQISMKDRQNYDNLVKDIEVKLNNKFDMILEKISQQRTSSEQTLYSSESSKYEVKEVGSKVGNKNEKNIEQEKLLQKPEEEKKNQVKDFYKKEINQQPSEPSFNSQEKSYSSDFENNETEQQLQSNLKTQNSKTNTSILQKDPSKIIKSKTKNTSILENSKSKKELFTQNIQREQEKYQKQEIIKKHEHKVESESSIDSIDIIDSRMTNFNKSNMKHQPQIKESFVAENVSTKPLQKKEDNFYMKRIKEQKNKMESSIKIFKAACDNLALPVNETFLVMFALSYKSFCEVNSFSMESTEANQIIFSKYSSESELKSKIPASEEKFIIDSLLKIEKMINLKCPADKKLKIEEYTKSCLACIENVFFEKPNLNLECEPEILKKLRDIKSCMST